MSIFRIWSIAALAAVLLAGCASNDNAQVPGGAEAYAMIPPQSAGERVGEYRIGPFDELSVTVFQEPDLSLTGVPVDAAGNILMPLIGQVRAEDRTARDLSAEIARRFDQQFLIDPQVSVTVTRSVSQRITVDGQVKKPGVYEVRGRTTLLQSVALAEGMTEIAQPEEIIVIREQGGQRLAAKFDIRLIRNGSQADPLLRGGDVVVVGVSGLRRFYQDVLKTAPLLGSAFIAVAN